ncbi:MAG: hypothetical protein RMY29_006780 [Nostoc sp. CreGUA01]|nr:hypothetical protein [Nostoc sp. CreGUA01]
MGHGAWGMGHGALGIGHGGWGDGGKEELLSPSSGYLPTSSSPSSPHAPCPIIIN